MLPSCHAGHCHPPQLTAPSRATARAPIVTLCHGLSAQAEMTEMWGEKAVEGTSSQLLPYCTAAVPEPRSGTGSSWSGRVRARQVGTITFPAACGCTGGCLCHPDYFCNPASSWSECIHVPTDRRFPSGTHRESPLSPPWAAPMAPGSSLLASPCGEPATTEPGHPRAGHPGQGRPPPGPGARAAAFVRAMPSPARHGRVLQGTEQPRSAPCHLRLCPRPFPSEGPSKSALLAAVPGPGPVLRPRGSPSPSAVTSVGPAAPGPAPLPRGARERAACGTPPGPGTWPWV